MATKPRKAAPGTGGVWLRLAEMAQHLAEALKRRAQKKFDRRRIRGA